MPNNPDMHQDPAPGPILRYLTGADLTASGNAEARLFFRRIGVALFLAIVLVAKAIAFCAMLVAMTGSWGLR